MPCLAATIDTVLAFIAEANMFGKFLAACLIGLGIAGSAAAATVRPILLDEIIDSSAVAFHGTCIANRVELDPVSNFIVTYSTFAVRDVIKGAPAATHVIKQIGGTMPGGESGMIVRGVPKFVVGEEYVLFLAGISSMGFSSPVGLAQGRFAVQEGKAGKTVASGRDFRELTARMPLAALREPAETGGAPLKELGLEDFKQMARSHASRRQ